MIDPFNPLDPRTLSAGREARGLTCSELARLAAIQATTISRIEAGKDPRLSKTWAPIVAAMKAAPVTRAA